ncbi:MAG: hypothetical protein H7841_13435 [Magnetospirillum sp. WYHS-4]
MTRKTAVSALALLLGGCMSDWFGDSQPSRWQNPNLPPAQWSKDEEACRRWANAEAEKEGSRDAAIASDRGEAVGGHGGTYASQSAAVDAKRRRALLTSDCLKSRGYVRVQK